MHIIVLSKSEFDSHIATSVHRYAYYYLAHATLEVVLTVRGAFKASFIDRLPEGHSYANNGELADLNLLCVGTPFQIKVWRAAQAIPTGATASYNQIAEHIGHPQAYRAVGSALARNRLAYLIPCHRVIKKDGQIRGYRWGDAIKGRLLGWESPLK